MNVRDFECRSYERALELRGDDGTWRRVCNNTNVCTMINGLAVSLHGHMIVRFRNNGEIMLDSCGFRTATTKDRINRCLPLPWRVCQSKGEWKLWKRNDVDLAEEIPFVDGMTVPTTN